MLLSYLYLSLTLFVQSSSVFTCTEGGFRIQQKGEYKEKWQEIETAIGPIETFTYFFEPQDSMQDPNYLYLINYMEYPAESFEGYSAVERDSFLIQSVDELRSSMDAKINYSIDLDLKDSSGLLCRMEFEDKNQIVKTKLILRDHRFYSIQVFTTAANSLNKEMDLFLDSFSFLPID